MKVLKITNTEIDLQTKRVPFLPNNTVVVTNYTAGSLVLQETDTAGSGYATLATIPTLESQEVTLNKQYIRVSTAANLFAYGN